jgi:RimJ/RimL family protein N-acetyltransferase
MGERLRDGLQRYGAAGLLLKTALRPVERLLDFKLEWQYSAPLADVWRALDKSLPDDRWQMQLLVHPVESAPWIARLQDLNPAFNEAAIRGVDRIVVALCGDEIGGYWCFTVRDPDLHERGVFVAPEHRGAGLAGRLLSAMISTHEASEGKLHASVGVANRSSQATLRKAGLRLAGLMSAARLPIAGDIRFVWEKPKR